MTKKISENEKFLIETLKKYMYLFSMLTFILQGLGNNINKIFETEKVGDFYESTVKFLKENYNIDLMEKNSDKSEKPVTQNPT
jgi:hypothetical protein